MIANPRLGWRYFQCPFPGPFSHWAWDPVDQKGYWLKTSTGEYCHSYLSVDSWQNDVEEIIDQDLMLDAGI